MSLFAAEEMQPSPPVSPESLWEAAQLAIADKDQDKAAELLAALHRKFPDAARAPEALLRAARIRESQALADPKADWSEVRDLYKMFVVDYQSSALLPEAYLGVIVAQSHMRLAREAVIYANLVSNRFPDHSVLPRVRYWKGSALSELGRLDEARGIFRELVAGPDKEVAVLATIRLGDVEFSVGDYQTALNLFNGVMASRPSHYLEDPELLKKAGVTNLRLGNEEVGREQLFRYLNLEAAVPSRNEALFEVGDSYFRGQRILAAQRLYRLVASNEEGDDLFWIFSQFRLAQIRDDPEFQLPAWRRQSADTGTSGDEPYELVIRSHYRAPIAQEARYGLIFRHLRREEHDRAFEVGRSYLRIGETPEAKRNAVLQAMGEILVHRVEGLLAEKEYKRTGDLYLDEYPIVEAYEQGRLLYLIGQAFQALLLNDEAAAIYFRALALPLSAAELSDLYLRRAEVYLALGDHAAADTLLTFLRDRYQGQPEMARINFLSGRQKEAVQADEEALAYYEQAFTTEASPEKKAAFGEATLSLLLAKDETGQVLSFLEQYRKKGILSPEQIQQWYTTLGDTLSGRGRWEEARRAYSVAAAEPIPKKGEQYQHLQLRLGRVLAKLGDIEESRNHYEKALSGESGLWKKVARERLNSLTINQTAADVEMLLK